jgi:hypothetical protein
MKPRLVGINHVALQALEKAAVAVLGPRLDFHDSSGNRVQIVQYDQIQFTKTIACSWGWGSRSGRPSPRSQSCERRISRTSGRRERRAAGPATLHVMF